MRISVGHVNRHAGVYVGRPSVLGNPYSHKPKTLAHFRVSCVREAIRCYAVWLDSLPKDAPQWVEIAKLASQFKRDGSLTLTCWCCSQMVEWAPDRRVDCHAGVVAARVMHIALGHADDLRS